MSFPEDKYVAVNGINLNYKDWGGDGQPVVLLHGLASSTHIWHFVAPLLSRSFRVVAVNQRGHGDSDKPDDGYDFATVATDLREFMKALGFQKPIVAGHSWGGNVAVQLAADNHGLCKGICLVDGGMIEISATPGMTLEKARVDMAPPDFTGITMQQMKERAKTWDFGFEVTPELRKLMLSVFEEQPDGTVSPKFKRANHMQVVDAFWDHRPTLLYPEVKCPVLLLPARRKEDSEEHSGWKERREKWVGQAEKSLSRSKTVWFEDSVHDVPLQRPELVASTVAEHIEAGFFD
ncbi:MAG: alpha/beta hydrolase [Chloroflexi bacterium]|nr:alpha/beta hydrolase [Chloroflexota bacterium]